MERGTILIVDDENSLRKVLSDLLKMRGYVPDAVATGPEAIERARTCNYDVAIVDLRLGEDQMTGMEVIREIKGVAPETQCIVLTANPSQQSAIQAVNLGAYSYLEKPFNYEILLETIKNAIGQRAENSPDPKDATAPRETGSLKPGLQQRLRRDCLAPLNQVADTAQQIGSCSSLDQAKSLALEIAIQAESAIETIEGIAADLDARGRGDS